MAHFLDTPCTYLSMHSKKYRQIDATISKNIDNLQMAHFLDTPCIQKRSTNWCKNIVHIPLHVFIEILTNWCNTVTYITNMRVRAWVIYITNRFRANRGAVSCRPVAFYAKKAWPRKNTYHYPDNMMLHTHNKHESTQLYT
jgi:hypothetical protein